MIEIALYQPDIAPNAATIARLCACFGLKLTIIQPAGFVFTDAAFKRAGMDYLRDVQLEHASSWEAFRHSTDRKRLVLLTTKATETHVSFKFQENDILLLGRESSGVPDEVHAEIASRIRIPMQPGMRSLNIAVAAGLVTGEALRQLNGFSI
jgi:tRNA (cytidine/uridine-2'-O-)-methyltransferase